jgi:hypothetical protein
MNAAQFEDMFRRLHNMDRWTLEEAGLITPGPSGDTHWTRFNNNLTTFVLKLSDANIEKLMALVFRQRMARELERRA